MDTKEQAAFFPATVMPDPDWWQALWPDPEGVVMALGVRPGMTVLVLTDNRVSSWTIEFHPEQ